MRAFSYLVAMLLLVACGKEEPARKANSAKVEVATPSAAKPSMSGQVFVVTKGRDNIKLALVEVAAISEKDVLQYVNAKHANGVEQQKLLTPAYETSLKEAEAASATAKQAKNASSQLTNKYLALSSGAEMDAMKPAWDASFENERRARSNAAAKAAHTGKLKSQIAYFESAEYYFEKLPSTVASSKTDADGKFTLSLPTGKYVIAATTSRKVGSDTEVYHWLVSVDTAASSQPLMLSNDNLFETKCKECVRPDRSDAAAPGGATSK